MCRAQFIFVSVLCAAFLLTEEGYARAAKGEDAALPGFRLRVSNADVVVLQYLPDASGLISMTR